MISEGIYFRFQTHSEVEGICMNMPSISEQYLKNIVRICSNNWNDLSAASPPAAMAASSGHPRRLVIAYAVHVNEISSPAIAISAAPSVCVAIADTVAVCVDKPAALPSSIVIADTIAICVNKRAARRVKAATVIANTVSVRIDIITKAASIIADTVAIRVDVVTSGCGTCRKYTCLNRQCNDRRPNS